LPYTYADVAKMIDHSLLRPVLPVEELEAGCRLAREYDVASVCILPYYLARCAELLAGSSVAPSTTIGFPHGGHATRVKVFEAEQALADGGVELDMVVNVSKVCSGDWAYVRDDVAAVLGAVRARGAKLKVIFENCYLTDEQKIRLCEIGGELSVDWVKTSTGCCGCARSAARARARRPRRRCWTRRSAGSGWPEPDRRRAKGETRCVR
jgi:deoxyribose-phosphate aldolase